MAATFSYAQFSIQLQMRQTSTYAGATLNFNPAMSFITTFAAGETSGSPELEVIGFISGTATDGSSSDVNLATPEIPANNGASVVLNGIRLILIRNKSVSASLVIVQPSTNSIAGATDSPWSGMAAVSADDPMSVISPGAYAVYGQPLTPIAVVNGASSLIAVVGDGDDVDYEIWLFGNKV